MASSVTITLKVSPAQKLRLQAQARREKKSLNAYVLGKVAAAPASPRPTVDYDHLTAHLGDRFSEDSLWRLVRE